MSKREDIERKKKILEDLKASKAEEKVEEPKEEAKEKPKKKKKEEE